MLTFTAIDVETANADWSSICQIGLVQVRDGEIRNEQRYEINPKTHFDPRNVQIHGINEAAVRNRPSLPQVYDDFRRHLGGAVLVSHTPVDRVALARAADGYKLERLQNNWLDSAKIARRAWPEEYQHRGWGLKNVAENLGISFRHHDALEDARACAQIVLRACEDAGLDLDGWRQRVEAPISPSKKPRKSVARSGDAEGLLYGEVVVFTGALSVSRNEAADMAAKAGCDVRTTVSGKTTMLVIGIQDEEKLKGYEKSSKHRKAEELISQGYEIQILSQRDFEEIINIR